jgi:hypothetical protein
MERNNSLYVPEKRIRRWLQETPRSFLDWEKTEGVLTPELYDKYKHKEGTAVVLRNQGQCAPGDSEEQWFSVGGRLTAMARAILHGRVSAGVSIII